MSNIFTDDNTAGYTTAGLAALNAEFAARAAGIEPYTFEWYELRDEIADEAARRAPAAVLSLRRRS